MAEREANATVPARYSRVDPWVISRDTAAEIGFVPTVFGAKEAMAYVQQSLSNELSSTR